MAGASDRKPAPGEQVPLGERLHDPFFWAAVKKRLGYLLGALGILATFGAVGIFATYVVVSTVRDGLRAPGWPQVPATVVDLTDDGAVYTYEFKGKKYSSTRLGSFWLGGSSEVDDWDSRMTNRLATAHSSKEPIPAWVNPDKPAEAMLDHQIRWKLLLFFAPFALGFGIVGIGGFFFFLWKAAGIEWRSTQPMLKPKTREMLTQWFFSVMWNAVAMPVGFIAIPDLWAKGEWFVLLMVAIFPVFGVLIIWGALITTWHVIRGGNPFNPVFFEDLKRS